MCLPYCGTMTLKRFDWWFANSVSAWANQIALQWRSTIKWNLWLKDHSCIGFPLNFPMDGKTRGSRKYTLQEVRCHNTATDCWIIIDGKVYDVSKWLKYHPGGVLPLLYSAGQDCSRVFKAFHPFSWVREKRLPPFYIGDICEPDNDSAKESAISSELDEIHREIAEEGGYKTYCKWDIYIAFTYPTGIVCVENCCYIVLLSFVHVRMENLKKASFKNYDCCVEWF